MFFLLFNTFSGSIATFKEKVKSRVLAFAGPSPAFAGPPEAVCTLQTEKHPSKLTFSRGPQ